MNVIGGIIKPWWKQFEAKRLFAKEWKLYIVYTSDEVMYVVFCRIYVTLSVNVIIRNNSCFQDSFRFTDFDANCFYITRYNLELIGALEEP